MRTRQAITDTGLLGERMLAVEDRNYGSGTRAAGVAFTAG
jgi:hypothetical protein